MNKQVYNQYYDRYERKILRLTLLNPETLEKYDLYYRLYNIPLTKKWIKHFLNLRQENYSFREKKVQFKYKQDHPTLIKRFNFLIDNINSFYDIKLNRCIDINEETLNYLHDAYAVYGKRVAEKLKEKYWDTAFQYIGADDPRINYWPGITFHESMHQSFIDLNDLIHNVELSNADSLSDEYSGFVALASFEPRTDFSIEDEDLSAMKVNLDFGDLCLGYNTLGKNLRQIVLDHDKHSLETGMVVPQVTWSNEIMTHMKSSDNTPWDQHEYYKKWKNLSPENYGFNYGDFLKNREGYFCIGHLLSEQKNKIWDDIQSKFRIDLTSYSTVFDIDLLLDEVAYDEYFDPKRRNWKPPIPQNGQTINEIRNPYFSVVTWVMNDICNYSCRYCPPFLHNGKNYKQQEDWNNISEFIQHTIDMLGSENRKVIFSISGGEPTLSPFFPQLIKKISDLGHFSRVTTNLSRTPRYIEENFKYLLGASCSFHPAMEFTNGTADRFLENLEVANTQTWAAARIMMDPMYWDQTVEFIERVKKETTAYVEVVMIESQYGSGPNVPKYADINYTDEQINFINNFQIINNRGKAKRKSYTDLGIQNAEFLFADGSVAADGVNYQDLINKGQTNFYDYSCEIGNGSMFIHQTGSIRKANCHVGGNSWGTISDWKKINWTEFKKPVVCSQISCTCGADVPITKRRNK